MELAAYCSELVSACEHAEEWVNDNADLVRNEQEGLLKDLRRAGRLFRRVGKAATRKMCAGVFGPSQAGKSYLISALARDRNGTLLARFGSEEHDFIQEINPVGGKESTGLVTRFTLTKPARLPDGYPVQIRLLSEMDLVKIIANTYYADCEHKEESVSSIEDTLRALDQMVRKENTGIDINDLEDLREYMYRDFRAKARVQLLERSYWDKAIAIGSHLDLEGRVRLYALIWDEVEEFTDLLRSLLKAIESLGHPEEVYCAIEALIPRQGSIIDVATLSGLEEESNRTDTLEIVTGDGKRAVLPRAYVTALTAELTIVMDEPPAPYFQTTDLLDFPGYRSRYKFDNVRLELKKKGILKELFLRGKVAYLFQRYCQEHELACMLLCIGPSNQEVQDLPSVINEWVCQTHGANREAREGRQISLFFILTKFDMEFEQKKGEPSVETRWDNRLHASLLDFFGKQHDWPKEWDRKNAFNNLFFLRNPNFRFDAILQYDNAGREIGIREDMQDYVKKLESAFMKSTLVHTHFVNPREAWDAAMLLNDGGITRIRECLSPMCRPEIKEAQLEESIRYACGQIQRRLKAFYRSDNREELYKQKLVLIKKLFFYLGKLEQNFQRLGLLIRAFSISDAEIFELYPEAFRRYLEQPEAEEILQEEAPGDFEEVDPTTFNLDDLNPFDTGKKGASKEESQPKAKRDEASFFAEYIESSWIAKLHALADDASMQKYFQLQAQEFSALVSELATGAVRLDLRAKMIAAFHAASAYVNKEKQNIVWEEASTASNLINSYVNWLGLNPYAQNPNDRTVRVGTSEHICFTPPKAVKGSIHLQETREDFQAVFFGDWLHALAGLITANVNFDGERELNVEENAKLGAIISVFGKMIEQG